MPRIVAVVGAVLLLCMSPVTEAKPWRDAGLQDVSLETLLFRLGEYVDKYEDDLATVVSEEVYEQEVTPSGRRLLQKRVLRSDFLLTRSGAAGWVAFRDVAEVDGRAVRDRSDRLVELFIHPTGDAADQVKSIVEASSRLNLGWVNRNINVPTMVLQVARKAEQGRSEFILGKVTDIGGVAAREIRFRERSTPRMIDTRDGAPASGRFWVDSTIGRVLKTELQINTGSTTAVVTVAYDEQPELDLWLPVSMEERYSKPGLPSIKGRAVYSNFRRFDVTVSIR